MPLLTKSRIQKLKDKYGDIFYSNIMGYEFIWRELTNKEFRFLNNLDPDVVSGEEKEEIILEYCVVYPEDINIDEILGGIPSKLVEHILTVSGLYPEQAEEMLSLHRQEMQDFESQMEAVVIMAFPSLSLEDIESWSSAKLIKYFTRAEFLLTNLQGLDVGGILSELNQQQGLVGGSKEDFPEIFGTNAAKEV